MKLYPATWDDLAYKTPEFLSEALQQKECTGNMYKKICRTCELHRRLDWERMYGTAVVGVTQGSGSTGQGNGSANSGLDNPPLQHPWASMAAIN